LPKPFTKEGLLEMLEKHLMHLKAIQRMARVPRALPPAGTAADDDSSELSQRVMPSTSVPVAHETLNDGKLNPLDGMGLSDDQYAQVLQELLGHWESANAAAASMPEKRRLEEVVDIPEAKRGKFEVVD